jgi:hypothetical protein
MPWALCAGERHSQQASLPLTPREGEMADGAVLLLVRREACQQNVGAVTVFRHRIPRRNPSARLNRS